MSIIYQTEYQKTHMRKIFEAIAYTGLTAIATVAVLVVVSLVWGNFWNDVPVSVIDLDPPLANVCPGQSYDIRLRITTTRKILIVQYVSVMNPQMTENYQGTQVDLPSLPQPIPTSFVETIPWEVPQLPPGDYVRMMVIRSSMNSQDPLFHPESFSIGENCES
jgi:hypothetical protein